MFDFSSNIRQYISKQDNQVNMLTASAPH